MHAQIVMDANGDTRHQFDATDIVSVMKARKRFEALIKSGYIAAKRTGDGKSELVREFDRTVRETLFLPRLVGG